MRFLFLALLLVPLIELYLLIRIGARIGFWPTLALTLLMGIVGMLLARREGRRVWRTWREALASGRTPDEGVIDGVLILAGGALLMAPGVLTDVAGLLLLVPATRHWAALRLRRSLERRVDRLRTSNIAARGPRVVETQGESLD